MKTHLTILVTLIVTVAFHLSAEEPLEKLTGYKVFKKGGSFIHASFPTNYDPEQSYPLLVGLHYMSGNGQAFLPLLQIEANRKGWIVAAPDSADHFTWKVDNTTNAHIVKRTVRVMQKEFNIAPDKIFLYGHDAGGTFILYLLRNHQNALKDFSGCIITAAESQSFIENKTWSKMKHRSRNASLPILYLYSTDDQQIAPSMATWTKEALREAGYSVLYREYNDYGHNFPDHLLRPIMDWCLAEKKDADEIIWKDQEQPAKPFQPEPITDSVTIKSISPHVLSNLSLNIKAMQKKTVDSDHYNIFFKINEPNINLDVPSPEDNENYWFEMLAFDKEKNLVYRYETAVIGLEAGLKMTRDYGKENYGDMHKERDERIEEKYRLKTGSTAQISFAVPKRPKHKYVAIVIKRNGKVAALKTHPHDIDHHQFKELNHLYTLKEWEAYLTAQESNPGEVESGPIFLPVK